MPSHCQRRRAAFLKEGDPPDRIAVAERFVFDRRTSADSMLSGYPVAAHLGAHLGVATAKAIADLPAWEDHPVAGLVE